MVNVALITPTPPDVSALGIRNISAYLKRQGHKVKTFLLPGGVEERRYEPGYIYHYPQKLIDSLLDNLKDIDVIGLSFMTNYFDRAVQVTDAIKSNFSIPIVWGGVHPTVRPEESIEYVDYVCVGEGEIAFSEFLNRLSHEEDVSSTPNFWVRSNGKIIQNEFAPLIQDLDSLPPLDYSFDDQFSVDLRKNEITLQDKEFLRQTLPVRPNLEGGFDPGYVIMTERGCPFTCTYCINNQMRRMAGSQRYLRRRSISHVVIELKDILAKLPFIKTIIFFDDTLSARPLKDLKEFAEVYPREIGLPFHGQVSPTTINPTKWELLLKAGMIFVEMGIQTGNEHVRKLFHRHSTNEEIITAISLINSSKKQVLSPCYHIILDNPWESPSQLMETLDLILQLPHPYWLKRASLVLYPGTALFQKAMKEGLIHDEHEEIYRKHLHSPNGNYLNLLFYLSDWRYIPRSFLRFLARPYFVKRFHKNENSVFYQKLMRFGDFLILIGKGISAVVTGDFARLIRYIKRIR